MESKNSLSTSQSGQLNELQKATKHLFGEQRRQMMRWLRQIPSTMQSIRMLRISSQEDVYRVLLPKGKRLGRKSNGKLTPNWHHKGSGKFAGQATLEKIQPDMLLPLQQIALQSTITEMMQQLDAIEDKVDRVLQGQRDDRFGRLDSGVELYVLAAYANDSENRRQMLNNAVTQLSEARSQLMRSFETDIKSLENLPNDKFQINWATLIQGRNLSKEVKDITPLLTLTLREILRASVIMILTCNHLRELGQLDLHQRYLQSVLSKFNTVKKSIENYMLVEDKRLLVDLTKVTDSIERVVQAISQFDHVEYNLCELEDTARKLLEEAND